MRLGSRTLALHRNAALWGAALWGFAEATLFFIVPDVLLSCLALSSLKNSFRACLAAAVAATCGGLLVWSCASAWPEATHAVLLKVPGISEATFLRVRDLLATGLFPGMLQGAFAGVPYKIFAAQAATGGINPALFTFFSPLARLPRFVAMSLFAFALSRLVGTRLSERAKIAVCLSLWAAFYVWYFAKVGW